MSNFLSNKESVKSISIDTNLCNLSKFEDFYNSVSEISKKELLGIGIANFIFKAHGEKKLKNSEFENFMKCFFPNFTEALEKSKDFIEVARKTFVKQYTLESRDVAEMVDKRHTDLIRDIETYIKYIENSQNANLRYDDFFIESSYNAGTGKNYKCYFITRKGCEFIANKMTGQKGTLFTAAYINKFHEMEQALQEPAEATQPANTNISEKLIETLLDKIQNLEKQITEINDKVKTTSLLALPETSAAFDPLFKTPTIRYTTTAIGEAFGISARAVNRYLLAQNIQRPEGSGWVLNKRYANCNFVYQKTALFTMADDKKEEKLITWWTSEGMEFVRMLLINAGLKQKSVIQPYDRHGERGKRAKQRAV